MRRPITCAGQRLSASCAGVVRATPRAHQLDAVAGECHVRCAAKSVLRLLHVRVRGFRLRERFFFALLRASAAACRKLRQRRLCLVAVHLLPLVGAAHARTVRRRAGVASTSRAHLSSSSSKSRRLTLLQRRGRRGSRVRAARRRLRPRVLTEAAAAACRPSGAQCWRRARRPRRRCTRGSPRARTARAPP